jgi:hypothetical protein
VNAGNTAIEWLMRDSDFLGAAAAASAGPGMRFVSLTGPAAAAIRQSLLWARARK